MLKHKKIFIPIILLIIFIYICYKLVSLNYLKFNCIGEQKYDFSAYKKERFNYLKKFDAEIELDDYTPEWCFISSQQDLNKNDLGVDLSNVDLSHIDFKKNNVLITFGCELYKIKIYKPLKSIGDKVKYVDVCAREREKDLLYIYIIDKVEVRDNMLSPRVIIEDKI